MSQPNQTDQHKPFRDKLFTSRQKRFLGDAYFFLYQQAIEGFLPEDCREGYYPMLKELHEAEGEVRDAIYDSPLAELVLRLDEVLTLNTAVQRFFDEHFPARDEWFGYEGLYVPSIRWSIRIHRLAAETMKQRTERYLRENA